MSNKPRGRYSRGEAPLVLSSEVSAFFKYRGHAVPVRLKDDDPLSYTVEADASAFHAFEKTAYGIWHLRTDGRTLLLTAPSGRRDMKEAYAFDVDGEHEAKPGKVKIK